jgi:hypothetical protein
MNQFSQLFNVHDVSDVKPTEIHTAEPELSAFDQVPAELIKAGRRTICSEIHNHINSILSKEELPEEWKESIIVPIYKKGDD